MTEKFLKYGNTETESILCRFHLATENMAAKKSFPLGNVQRTSAAKGKR